ncbi:hypothetical protein RJ639_036166 [Escallonia herrerae]|uniref:Glutaredoxin domain-containing protein n=1 Tax=Escallonia herrerae TaxID=1293975 RepID=A0AA89B7V3_9ASTE|nr:hypothetical protein RJ639_036166 [Escallonia herrerae]
MKDPRGRLLKKLKSISAIATLKQGLVFQVATPECKGHEHKHNSHPEAFPCRTNVSGLVTFYEDEETALIPQTRSKDSAPAIDEEGEAALGSRSNNACTVPLADRVQLLTASQTCNFQPDPIGDIDISAKAKRQLNSRSSSKAMTMEAEERSSLLDFEEKCPPGGKDSVIIYTTSLRGIRKTFEDCNTIQFLLESFRVLYHERDVSMHLEFREELWRVFGGRVVPPRVFIRGRYIGGADEVVGLHEQGKLRKLLDGIPINPSDSPCIGCAGVRWALPPRLAVRSQLRSSQLDPRLPPGPTNVPASWLPEDRCASVFATVAASHFGAQAQPHLDADQIHTTADETGSAISQTGPANLVLLSPPGPTSSRPALVRPVTAPVSLQASSPASIQADTGHTPGTILIKAPVAISVIVPASILVTIPAGILITVPANFSAPFQADPGPILTTVDADIEAKRI